MNHSLASSQQGNIANSRFQKGSCKNNILRFQKVYPDGFKTAPNEDEADTHRQLNIAHRVPAFLRKLYM